MKLGLLVLGCTLAWLVGWVVEKSVAIENSVVVPRPGRGSGRNAWLLEGAAFMVNLLAFLAAVTAIGFVLKQVGMRSIGGLLLPIAFLMVCEVGVAAMEVAFGVTCASGRPAYTGRTRAIRWRGVVRGVAAVTIAGLTLAFSVWV